LYPDFPYAKISPLPKRRTITLRREEIMRKPYIIVSILAISLISPMLGASSLHAGQGVLVGEALGAASAIALYNSLTIIGMTADMLGKKIYSDQQILALLTEQKGFMVLMADYMTRLVGQPPLSAAGEANLLSMGDAAKKMQATIDALTDYVKAPDKAKADDFLKKKQAAADVLKKLLGRNP
jgi:hypothetical protein